MADNQEGDITSEESVEIDNLSLIDLNENDEYNNFDIQDTINKSMDRSYLTNENKSPDNQIKDNNNNRNVNKNNKNNTEIDHGN